MAVELADGIGFAVLDLLVYPVLVADIDGKIVAHNKAASRLLKSSRPFRDSGNHLRRMVAEACRANALNSVCFGHGSKHDRLAAIVAPLHFRHRGNAPARCAALWFVSPHTARAPDSEAMTVLFGLSPAEAKLASALLSGQTPSEYARARRLKIATVRSHLHHTFIKTGARRQSELIALLLKAPPVAMEH